MSEQEDQLVEKLRKRRDEDEQARERLREEERARRQARADHDAAFSELAAIPRARLEAAAEKAGIELVIEERGGAVGFRLGESKNAELRIEDLGQTTKDVPGGQAIGAAYFGQVSNPLNSCNFVRIVKSGAPRWQAWRFRISGAVAGESVAARLRLRAVPKFEDLFGIDDVNLLYEQGSRAIRMTHVVTLDVTDDLLQQFEQIIDKAIG